MTNLDRKDGLFRGDYLEPTLLDLKELDETGEFEGFAATFGDVDAGNDIVMAGAFRETLVKRPAPKIKMLFQHRPDEIIGKWLEARETDRGLQVKGKLFLNIRRAAEVHELMQEHQLEGLSIGYRTQEYEIDRDLGVRRLKKVDLREVSVVTFPMNEHTAVSLVKGDTLPTEREFERFLVRDAGFSAQQAKGIIAHGYKSLISVRDAGCGDAGLSAALRQATARLRA